MRGSAEVLVSSAQALCLVFMCCESGAAQKSASEVEVMKAEMKRGSDLWERANKLEKNGQIAEAISVSQKSLEIAKANVRRDPTNRAVLGNYAVGLTDLAHLYLIIGEFGKAEQLKLQALDVDKTRGGERDHDYLLTLDNLAGFYDGTVGDYSKAEAIYLRELELRKSAHGVKDRDYARTLIGLSWMYARMGRYVDAMKRSEEALEINKSLRGEGLEYARCIRDIGNMYEQMGAYTKAEAYFQQALKMQDAGMGFTKKGQGGSFYHNRIKPDGTHEQIEVTEQELMRIEATGTVNDLANLYEKMGDRKKAESLRIEVTDRAQKYADESFLSVENDSLENSFMDNGEWDKAEGILLEKAARAKSKYGAKSAPYARTLEKLGRMYRRKGDNANAESSYLQALEIGKSWGKVLAYADSLVTTADFYFRIRDYQKAMPLYEEAKDIRGSLESTEHPDYAMSLERITQLYSKMGRWPAAEPLARQVAEIYSKSKDPAREKVALWNLADSLRIEGRLTEAVQEFDKSFDVYERLRGQFGGGERRAFFQDAQQIGYANMAAAQIEAGHTAEGFETVERGRSRVLDEMLATRELNVGRGFKTTREMEAAELQLAALSKKRTDFSQSGPGAEMTRSARAAALDARSAELEKQRAELVQEINQSDPELGSLVTVEAPRLDELQTLIGMDASMVEYWHPGELNYSGGKVRDELWVFILSNGSLDFITVPVKQRELTDTIENWEKLLSDSSSSREELTSASAALYGWLIAPIESRLTTQTLVVVPWGAMFKVPIGALTPRNGKPLSVDRDVVIAPSAGSCRYIAKKRASGRRSLFAAGNPETTLPSLQGAERETREIAALFGQSHVKVGAQASETVLKSGYEALGRPDVVHLACHGIFNERVPQLSYLALTPDAANDGDLEMHEVFGLDWRGVSLVTLSSCASGKAKLGAGDDLVGLVRGFIFAGAPSVLCSLWDVDDEATCALMVEFYKQYLAGKSKPDALRLAQTAVRANKDHPAWAHPYYWSAFVMFGDWQ